MSTNLVNELPKRELWERIQETNPDFEDHDVSGKKRATDKLIWTVIVGITLFVWCQVSVECLV